MTNVMEWQINSMIERSHIYKITKWIMPLMGLNPVNQIPIFPVELLYNITHVHLVK